MKQVMLRTAFVVMCAVLPVNAQDTCSDILKKGVFKNVTVRGSQQLETLQYSQIKKSEGSESQGSLIVPHYGSGKFHKNTHAALKDTQFNWLSQTSEIAIVTSSGDNAILESWLSCMNLNLPGPTAWFEASDSKTIRLHMRYNLGKDTTARTSFKLTHNVVIPPSFNVLARADCLRAGAEIPAGGCIVRLSGGDPYEPLRIELNTDIRDLTVDLPPRLKIVEDRDTRETKFRVSMAPRKNGAIQQSARIEKGWYLVPGSQTESYVPIDAKNGGIKCRIPPAGSKESYREGPTFFSTTIWADNNSPNDTGHCDYTISYVVFRLRQEPL